jgi:hypothetical protein
VDQLLSKLIAGGLSAAVILIWWPLFFPVDSVETWLARGVVWTLSFELLLHALAPFERSLWRSAAAARVRTRAAAAGTRLAFDDPRIRVRGRGAVACAAIAVPALLLATAPAPPPKEKPVQAATVKHVTQIKRVVRVEEPQPATAAAAVSADPAARPEAPAAPVQAAAPVRDATPVAQRRAASTPDRGRSTAQSHQDAGTGSDQPAATTEVETQPGGSQPSTTVRQPEATGMSGASQRSFAG